MQSDTDFHLDDEQLYNKYINNLSLTKAIANYIQARTYEPVLMLGYGVVLAAKTPTYLISPGVAGQSWKKYFLFFGALGVRCDITRRELTLKLKQKIKNSVEPLKH